MTYIKKTRNLFRTLYTSVAGIGLIVWVFVGGSADSNDSKTTSLVGPQKAYADAPSCGSCESCSTCGCACAGGGSCGDGGSCSGSDSGGAGGASCGTCFPPTARVETEHGPVPISELKVGDTVISYDETSDTFTTSRIEKILKHGKETGDAHDFNTAPLMKLVYDREGSAQEVLVTANHPVYDVASKTYKPVSELAIGGEVMTQDGIATITQLEAVNEAEHFDTDPIVYNLTLADGPHTYVADGMVVHNKGGGDGCLPGSAKIQTPDGEILMNEVAEGMEVMSYDEQARAWGTSIVGRVIVHDGKQHESHEFAKHPLYEVSLQVPNREKSTLIVTGNHPCFDPEQNGYRPIAEFREGEMLMTPHGNATILTMKTVTPVDFFGEDAHVVYDLHMSEGPANYVADNVLVHNKA